MCFGIHYCVAGAPGLTIIYSNYLRTMINHPLISQLIDIFGIEYPAKNGDEMDFILDSMVIG